jgi:hypothetical protein
VAPFKNCDSNLLSNGCEVNTQTDKHNCGDCNIVCPADQTCSGSMCVCPSGMAPDTSNGGVCAKICSSNQDCFGNAAGDLCINGLCVTQVVSCGQQCTDAGGTCCGSICTDTRFDLHNCGGCNSPVTCSSQEICCYVPAPSDHSSVVGSLAICASVGGTPVGGSGCF